MATNICKENALLFSLFCYDCHLAGKKIAFTVFYYISVFVDLFLSPSLKHRLFETEKQHCVVKIKIAKAKFWE
jgi:hypothetical protein